MDIGKERDNAPSLSLSLSLNHFGAARPIGKATLARPARTAKTEALGRSPQMREGTSGVPPEEVGGTLRNKLRK